MNTDLIGEVLLKDNKIYLKPYPYPIEEYLNDLSEGSYRILANNKILGEVYFDGRLKIHEEILPKLENYKGKVIELSLIEIVAPDKDKNKG